LGRENEKEDEVMDG